MLKSISNLTLWCLLAIMLPGVDVVCSDEPNAGNPAQPGQQPEQKAPAQKPPVQKPATKQTASKPDAPNGKGQEKDRTKAQDKSKDKAKSRDQDKSKEKEREAAALAFAGLHHPELTGLVEQLKESNPAEYQRAIRDLSRTRERLAQIEQKEPQRYELELSAWKISSRIRLIVARLTMARDPALEQELRDALAQQAGIRLDLLMLEQEQLKARLKKLDAQIEKTRTDRDEQAKKDFDTVIRSITKAGPGQKPGSGLKPDALSKKVTQQSPQRRKDGTVKNDAAKNDPLKDAPVQSGAVKSDAGASGPVKSEK